MKGLEIVKAWNECKHTNFSKGSEENPSQLIRRINSFVNDFGEELVTDYFTELMLNEEISSDINSHAYYHLLAAYKKKVDDEKKEKDFMRDSSVVAVLGKELVKLMGTELAAQTENIIKQRLDAYVSDKVITKSRSNW